MLSSNSITKNKLYTTQTIGISRKFIHSDLLWIMIVGGFFRLFYYSNFIDGVLNDSPSYLNYWPNIFHGEVDAWRTPVYPYFIKLIRAVVGSNVLIHCIVVVQSLISFATILFFYGIVKAIFKERIIIVAATLLYAISPSLVNYDKCILTESLSISFIVIFLRLIIHYLNHPTFLKAALYTLVIFLSIMLRPSFIILIPMIFVFWILRLIFIKEERNICLAGIGACIVCVILLMGYSYLNYKTNGYKNLSAVVNLNQMDLIITYDMYQNGNDREISETIKDNVADTVSSAHWNIHAILFKKYSPGRISAFINNCIINQPATYIRKTLVKIYLVASEKIATQYAQRKSDSINFFSIILRLNFFTFGSMYFLIICDFLFIAFQWISRKKILWFRIILWLIITAQITSSIIGSPGDYPRLFVIALPGVIMVFFSYLDILFYALNKVKINEYMRLAKF